MFKGHVIMVFPKYGLSLFDFLEQNAFRPFELKTIQPIAYNLFATLYCTCFAFFLNFGISPGRFFKFGFSFFFTGLGT
jgi:hypothetical protein